MDSVVATFLTIIATVFTYFLTRLGEKIFIEPGLELERELAKVRFIVNQYANVSLLSGVEVSDLVMSRLEESRLEYRKSASTLIMLDANIRLRYFFKIPNRDRIKEISSLLIGLSNVARSYEAKNDKTAKLNAILDKCQYT